MGRSNAAPLPGERTAHSQGSSHAKFACDGAEFGCATLVGGGGLLLFRDDLLDLQAEALGYAGAVCGIGFVEVLDLQLLDAARDAAHTGDDVADEALFGVGGHQAEEIARLRVVVGVEAVVVAGGPGRGRSFWGSGICSISFGSP